jgi:hypothetical protein
MDIFALIAAFGGGVLAATIGALPTFIFAGFIVIAGAAIELGGGSDFVVGNVAFGSFFGPHIAFSGGVAAAAFAANKKKLMDSGANIVAAGFGHDDASPLLVGGVFGVIGYLIHYLYAGVLAIPTDTVALTVATLGIIIRFAFGSTGLFGKFEGDKREWIPTGTALMKTLCLGVGVGALVGGVAASLFMQGVDVGVFPVLCFGISAGLLIFTQCGFAVPGTHHISLPAGLAAVGAMGGGDPMMGVVMGIVFGVLGSFMGDVVGRAVNSHCDSHIDPPAITIFTLTFITIAVF